MAKQKITTDEAVPGAGTDTFQEQSAEGAAQQENTVLETTTTDTEPQAETSQPKQPATPAPEKRETKQSASEPDGFALGILKSFPNYESLYVDRHGGVFTPDTPKTIRGSATLYKNPHFKA